MNTTLLQLQCSFFYIFFPELYKHRSKITAWQTRACSCKCLRNLCTRVILFTFIHFYSILFTFIHKARVDSTSKGAAGGAVSLNVLSWGRRVEIFKGGGGWLWKESKCLQGFIVQSLISFTGCFGLFWLDYTWPSAAFCFSLLLSSVPSLGRSKGTWQSFIRAAIKPFQHFWSKK